MLPLEIREQIYRDLFLSYSDCLHILSGAEHDQSDRELFHTPCITPSDFEHENVMFFRDFRWRPGLWGVYHLLCDLRSCPELGRVSPIPSQHYGATLESSKIQLPAPPYMSFFLACRRMYPEAQGVVYSSTAFSFIGDSALNKFVQMVPKDTMRSIRRIHLAWPTWWMGHTISSHINGRERYMWEYWGHPSLSTAKSEWEQLWEKVSCLGTLKSLHVTIFHEKLLLPSELLPALCAVTADEFFVEAWGPEEVLQEPRKTTPYRLNYNPALGSWILRR